jgi:sigma-54 dependent transcriptional regulator, acetoin dehydrogenase operon transcriptional activator AcoR
MALDHHGVGKIDAPGVRRPAPPSSVRQAFERFRAGAAVPGLVEQTIEHSWKRCVGFGLEERRKPEFVELSRQGLNEAREQNRALALQALPVMENLYQQIVDTESMLLLTDPQGLILHSIGDDAFLARAEKVALRPGVTWSEQEKGTNAIGTAIVTAAPTLVHGAEHFLAANHFLTCSATPIADPYGRLIGVLDVTGDWRGYHRHTMALVRMSASVIENNLFDGAFPDEITLRFHARPELIGTLFQGIAVFRTDGTFVTANRSALFQLGLELPGLRGRSFAELFGVPLPAVLNQVAVRADRPVALSLRSGVRVMARLALGKQTVQDAPLAAPITTCSSDETRTRAPAATSTRYTPAASVDATFTLASLETGDTQVANAIGRVRRVLGRDIPILIQGETGTGKEMLAQAIHAASPRSAGPFVAVNCAAIPDGLIESELFGYEEGAFTGARKRGHDGKILQAHGGTLFLDEIGDMPPALQARLLRVLQERVVTPLGSVRPQRIDTALVCATHRHLKDAIAAGTFRQDLYYRLNGLTVTLPPLRTRSDLDVLVQRLIQASGKDGENVRVAAAVLDIFRRYRWPGNLRELCSVLRTSLAMLGADRELRREHLPDELLDELDAATGACAPLTNTPQGPVTSLRALETTAIERALAQHGGNVAAAARSLGVSRNTIYRRVPATRSASR